MTFHKERQDVHETPVNPTGESVVSPSLVGPVRWIISRSPQTTRNRPLRIPGLPRSYLRYLSYPVVASGAEL